MQFPQHSPWVYPHWSCPSSAVFWVLFWPESEYAKGQKGHFRAAGSLLLMAPCRHALRQMTSCSMYSYTMSTSCCCPGEAACWERLCYSMRLVLTCISGPEVRMCTFTLLSRFALKVDFPISCVKKAPLPGAEHKWRCSVYLRPTWTYQFSDVFWAL